MQRAPHTAVTRSNGALAHPAVAENYRRNTQNLRAET
jgi:hypothetical protein